MKAIVILVSKQINDIFFFGDKTYILFLRNLITERPLSKKAFKTSIDFINIVFVYSSHSFTTQITDYTIILQSQFLSKTKKKMMIIIMVIINKNFITPQNTCFSPQLIN